MDTNAFGALCIALGVFATHTGGAVASVITSWYQARRAQRADAIAEWKEFAEALQSRIAQLERDHADCQDRTAALEAEVKSLKAQIVARQGS